MAHVKLDLDMPRSSVWRPRDLRSLWVTALLMAEPYVLDEPVPQLGVQNLDPSGWTVPPGRYGLIRAAGIGIIAQDGLDDEARGYELLAILSAPDPNSRSQEHEGRRLARINGGWLVLNYAKYRDKDWTAAERGKRWRAAQKMEQAVTADAEEAKNFRAFPKARPLGKPVRAARYDDNDPIFEEAWSLWLGALKRPGLNKALAKEQWLRRVGQHGEDEPVKMLTKTREYAESVDRDRLARTDWQPSFIMLPQTFYGPKRRYDADWSPPTAAAKPSALLSRVEAELAEEA